jgi:hypothetical protein
MDIEDFEDRVGLDSGRRRCSPGGRRCFDVVGESGRGGFAAPEDPVGALVDRAVLGAGEQVV